MAKRQEPDAQRQVSLSAFAQRLRLARSTVLQAITDGRIRSAIRWGRGWVITDFEKAKAEWQANTRPRAQGGQIQEQPEPSRLAAATLRERLARAKLIELDYERKNRALVPARDVELRWGGLVVAARTKLLGLPSRAKQRLPHLTVADLGVLEELIRESLEELATGASE